jgi:hypothetical protein
LGCSLKDLLNYLFNAQREAPMENEKRSRKVSPILRNITGWALLAAAAGTFFDAYACDGCSDGSIGLIPLYIGFPIGSVGLVLVFRKASGWVPALLATLGLGGILFFMFTYPNGAEGWIGAVLIGAAHLYFPLPGRLASVLWVAAGILGFPAFNTASWGVISAFTVFGAATAVSGAFVLLGLRTTAPEMAVGESPAD